MGQPPAAGMRCVARRGLRCVVRAGAARARRGRSRSKNSDLASVLRAASLTIVLGFWGLGGGWGWEAAIPRGRGRWLAGGRRSVGRRRRAAAPNRFQYLAPSGRCWDVLEARGNHWRGMDPALWRDLSTWWRCCCKVHMISKRDSDVPTVCQASPRGVATKAIVEADLRFNRAQGGNRRGACRFINC